MTPAEFGPESIKADVRFAVRSAVLLSNIDFGVESMTALKLRYRDDQVRAAQPRGIDSRRRPAPVLRSEHPHLVMPAEAHDVWRAIID
jgi:hypothetical protein